MKVLIIEDEQALCEIMQRYLEKEHFIVETASTFKEAQCKIAGYDYDCILLDIMLPDGSGLNILQQLKEMRKQECVIIISAKDSIEDKVTGLDLGADDYLPKPFHLSEMVARVRSLVRRRRFQGEVVIELGNIKILPDKYEVHVDGRLLDLNRKEYDILNYFSSRVGHLIDKMALAETVWGDHIDQVDNFDFIYAQIKNLRKKLKSVGATVDLRAVYGFGYKMTIEE